MSQTTEALLETLYAELHSVAENKLRHERPEHTLQATALVNEAFLRIQDRPETAHWQSRSHFMRCAAEAMRRILVDHARARMTAKRGGQTRRSHGVELPVDLPLPSEEIIAIHECLDQFEAESPIKAQLVKLRVFAGLSHQEAADELGISRQTADRYWAFAKVRLFTMIS